MLLLLHQLKRENSTPSSVLSSHIQRKPRPCHYLPKCHWLKGWSSHNTNLWALVTDELGMVGPIGCHSVDSSWGSPCGMGRCLPGVRWEFMSISPSSQSLAPPTVAETLLFPLMSHYQKINKQTTLPCPNVSPYHKATEAQGWRCWPEPQLWSKERLGVQIPHRAWDKGLFYFFQYLVLEVFFCNKYHLL